MTAVFYNYLIIGQWNYDQVLKVCLHGGCCYATFAYPSPSVDLAALLTVSCLQDMLYHRDNTAQGDQMPGKSVNI